MSEEFESLFTIGVDTEGGITALDALEKKLLAVQTQFGGVKQTIEQFEQSLSTLQAQKFEETGASLRAAIVTPFSEASAGVLKLRGDIQSLSSAELDVVGTNIVTNITAPLQAAQTAASQTHGVIQSLNSIDLSLIRTEADRLTRSLTAAATAAAAARAGSPGVTTPPPEPDPIIPLKGWTHGGYEPESGGWRSRSGRFSTREKVMLELVESGWQFEEIGRVTQEQLDQIPRAAREALQMTKREFEELKEEVVGASIIPDMVREINSWLARIDTDIMTNKVRAMVDEISRELDKLGIRLQSVLPATYQTVGSFDYTRWWEDQERLTLYHGTTRPTLERYQAQGGIIPEPGHKAYFTPEPGLAWHFAKLPGGEREFFEQITKTGKENLPIAPMEDRVVLRIDVPPDLVKPGPWSDDEIGSVLFKNKSIFDWQAKALGDWQYDVGRMPWREFVTREPDLTGSQMMDYFTWKQGVGELPGKLEDYTTVIPMEAITDISEQFKTAFQATLAEFDLNEDPAWNLRAASTEDLPVGAADIYERVNTIFKELQALVPTVEVDIVPRMRQDLLQEELARIQDYSALVADQEYINPEDYFDPYDEVDFAGDYLTRLIEDMNLAVRHFDSQALPTRIRDMVDQVATELARLDIVLSTFVADFPAFDISEFWKDQEKLTLFTSVAQEDLPYFTKYGMHSGSKPLALYTNPFKAWDPHTQLPGLYDYGGGPSRGQFQDISYPTYTPYSERRLIQVEIPPSDVTPSGRYSPALGETIPNDYWLMSQEGQENFYRITTERGIPATGFLTPSTTFGTRSVLPSALTDITDMFREYGQVQLAVMQKPYEILEVLQSLRPSIANVMPEIYGDLAAQRLHPPPEVPALPAPPRTIEGEYTINQPFIGGIDESSQAIAALERQAIESVSRIDRSFSNMPGPVKLVMDIQDAIFDIRKLSKQIDIPVPKTVPWSHHGSMELWGGEIIRKLGPLLKGDWSVNQVGMAEMQAIKELEGWNFTPIGLASYSEDPEMGGRIRFRNTPEFTHRSMMHEIGHALDQSLPDAIGLYLESLAFDVLDQPLEIGLSFRGPQSFPKTIGEIFDKEYPGIEPVGEVISEATASTYPFETGHGYLSQIWSPFGGEPFRELTETIRRIISVGDVGSLTHTMMVYGDPAVSEPGLTLRRAAEQSLLRWTSDVETTATTPGYLGGATGELSSIPAQIQEVVLSIRAMVAEFQAMMTVPPAVSQPMIASPEPITESVAEGEFRELEIGEKVSEQLALVPVAAAEAVTQTIGEFQRLEKEVVGASIIPDMVRDINAWLARINVPDNVLAELELTAQQIQSTFAIPPDVAEYGLEVGAAMRGVEVPPYIQGVQSGWTEEAGVRKIKDAFSGRYTTANAAIVESFANQLADLQVENYLMDWEGYDPEILAGMRGWQQPKREPRLPVPDVTAGITRQEEWWEGDKKVGTLTTFVEQMERYDEATKQTTNITRETTTRVDELTGAMRKSTIETQRMAGGQVRVTRSVEDMGQGVDKATKSFGGFNIMGSRFLRHLVWIGQGIMLWGAINAVRDFGRQYIQTFSEMEQAAARTAFVIDATTSQILESQRRTSMELQQYGIGPSEAGQAGLTAARWGAFGDKDLAEDAAQLSMVMGTEMTDAMTNILAVQRQWNMSQEDTERILNTLATMYAKAPGDMQQFMDVMREGPALASQMGQSFEENMMMVARALSFLPGQTATGISGLFGRMLSRVYQPEIATTLASKYNIGVFDPETLQRRPGLEILDEVAAKYKEIQSESERAALAEVLAGVRGGQAWQDAKVLLDNWADGIRSGSETMREFGELSGSVLDTFQTKVEALSGAWDNLWQTIMRGEGPFSFVIDNLETITNLINEITLTSQAESIMASTGVERETLYSQYRAETGKEPLTTKPLFPPGSSIAWGMEKYFNFNPQITPPRPWTQDFLKWLTEEREPTGPTGTGPYLPVMRRTSMDEDGRAFRDTVTGAGDQLGDTVRKAGDDFSDSVQSATDTLFTTMLATGWTPPTGIVDLSDYSMSEINKAMSQSKIDTRSMEAVYRSFLSGTVGLKGEGLEEAMRNFTQKLLFNLQFFRLPGGEIKLMEGRDLLYYLKEIEENTRPLEGIWNVPEGMRVWVPIESTFYGKWRERQEEGEGELDVGLFNDAASRLGMASDRLGEAADKLYTYKGGEYSEQARGLIDSLIDPLRSNLVTIGEVTGVDFSGPVSLLNNIEKLMRTAAGYADQADAFRGAIDLVDRMDSFLRLLSPESGKGPFPPSITDTTESIKAALMLFMRESFPRQTPQEGGGLYLPVISRTWMDDYFGSMENLFDPFEEWKGSEMVIPDPLGVTMPDTIVSRGTQVGMLATGMPLSLSVIGRALGSISAMLIGLVPWLMRDKPQDTVILDASNFDSAVSVFDSAVNNFSGINSATAAEEYERRREELVQNQVAGVTPTAPEDVSEDIANSIRTVINSIKKAPPLVSDTSIMPSSYRPSQELRLPEKTDRVDVQIPTPMDVTLQPSLVSQGVQTGMIATGMPTSMSMMGRSFSSMTGLMATQLFWLAAIARNTAQVQPIMVTVEGGGTTTATATTTTAADLYRELRMSGATFEVPY